MTRSLLVLLLGGAPVVLVGAGCSLGFASPLREYDSDLLGEDGGIADRGATLGPDVADAGAPSLGRGNPLCQATKFSCFPDDERSSKCALPDAGDASFGACRVQPAEEPACGEVSASPKFENQSCTLSSDCAPGFECVGSPPACRRYCCESATCAIYGKATNKAFFCDVQPLAQNGKQAVPVCQLVKPCNLYNTLQGNDDCGTNLQCALVEVAGQLTTSCVAVGSKKVGEDCSADHCSAKLQCVGSPAKCRQLCDPKMPTCPMGQSCFNQLAILNAQGVGVCQ